MPTESSASTVFAGSPAAFSTPLKVVAQIRSAFNSALPGTIQICPESAYNALTFVPDDPGSHQ
jgi:hypothetical protein